MPQEMTCLPLPALPDDLSIPVLGTAKIPSGLRYGHFVPDGSSVFVFANAADVPPGGCNPTLQMAGPRERIYFDPAKTHCAIVTCGGLCPGINDVIRAIVLEAHHNYGVHSVMGIRYGLEGFIAEHGHEPMELTPASVSSIHEFGGTILGSSRGPQSVERIVDFLERRNISCLFVIGGDGTMRAAAKITEEIEKRRVKISVVCIPKTIDNDINFVAQTFGFDTAVEQATLAIRCAHTEALGAPNGIGLVKVMGREAGFIAAQSSLALRDVDFVLVPEDPFELYGENGFLAALTRRLRLRRHAVIMLAEGAGQHLLQATDERDASGNVRLGDIAALLIQEIDAHMAREGIEHTLKYIDPSYMVRSVPANPNDCIYCSFLGQNAVHAAMAGKTALVVSKWNGYYVHMPLSMLTHGRKRIDVTSNYWSSVLQSTGQYVYFQG